MCRIKQSRSLVAKCTKHHQKKPWNSAKAESNWSYFEEWWLNSFLKINWTINVFCPPNLQRIILRAMKEPSYKWCWLHFATKVLKLCFRKIWLLLERISINSIPPTALKTGYYQYVISLKIHKGNNFLPLCSGQYSASETRFFHEDISASLLRCCVALQRSLQF